MKKNLKYSQKSILQISEIKDSKIQTPAIMEEPLMVSLTISSALSLRSLYNYNKSIIKYFVLFIAVTSLQQIAFGGAPTRERSVILSCHSMGLESEVAGVTIEPLSVQRDLGQGVPHQNIDDLANRTGTDLLTFLRSNPKWKWALMNVLFSSIFPPDMVGNLKNYVGIVGGDVKPDNVGFLKREHRYNVNGRNFEDNLDYDLGLIDLDDGGKGYLIFDLIDTLIYTNEWFLNIDQNKMLDAFHEGLMDGQKGMTDGWNSRLKSLNQKLKNEYLQKFKKEMTKWRNDLLDMTENEELFYKKTKSGIIFDASSEALIMFGEVQQDLVKYLKENRYTILNVGVRIKETGGSMKVPRFVYLVMKDNASGNFLTQNDLRTSYHIFEFKYQPDPAVSQSDVPQDLQAQRVEQLNIQFRNAEPGNYNYLPTLTSGSYTFIVREREPVIFSGGDVPKQDEKEEVKFHREYHEAIYYWMGLNFGSQNPGFAQYMHDNRDQMSGFINRMVDDILSDARRLNSPLSGRGEP